MSTLEPRSAGLLELTREIYTRLNTRDFDAVVSMFGPTSVYDVSRWGLGTHAGRKAIRQFLEDWFGRLDAYEVHVDRAEDLGNGVVFVVVTQVAQQARARGVLRVHSAPVFVWSDGEIALLTLYPDIAEGHLAAVRAAGPSSQRNLALHAQIVEAIREGTVPDELLAPGFYIESRMTPATDYKYHGGDGLREWASDLFDAFADGPQYGVDEVIAASDTYVVAKFSAAGNSASSGEPVEVRWVGVTWFSDGRATRAEGYPNREQALRAVGLAE